MKVKLVAVGKRMPQWVDVAVNDFACRFSNAISFELITVPTPKRTRRDHPDVYKSQEAKTLLSHVNVNDWVVALDLSGKQYSTEQLARWLDSRMSIAQSVILMIGGPDGLAQECLQRADACWSLSELTFPHGLARVIVVEALYRAESLRCGHPYHRG